MNQRLGKPEPNTTRRLTKSELAISRLDCGFWVSVTLFGKVLLTRKFKHRGVKYSPEEIDKAKIRLEKYWSDPEYGSLWRRVIE
jgi:hypothetical protein